MTELRFDLACINITSTNEAKGATYAYIQILKSISRSSNARSTLDPMYDEGCPHRVADKSNCDLRPECVTIFVST